MLSATTHPKDVADYSQFFNLRNVVVFPSNDGLDRALTTQTRAGSAAPQAGKASSRGRSELLTAADNIREV